MIVDIRPQTVDVTIKAASPEVVVGNPIARDYVERDPYTGDYTVTPADAAITLPTANLRMTDNITINPIPSNYGRIAWNGSKLIVY